MNRLELSDAELSNGSSDIDVIALDAATELLDQEDSRGAQVVKLRFFGGLTIAQAAEAIGISPATADNDGAYARSWLRVRLSPDGDRE